MNQGPAGALLGLVASLLPSALCLLPSFPVPLPSPFLRPPSARGLWLLARKDAGNTGRCDVPGRMTAAPREVWSFGGGGETFSFCQPVRIGGKPRYFGLVRNELRLVEHSGKAIWRNGNLGVDSVLGVGNLLGNGGVQTLVTLGQTGAALVDAATGKLLWKWTVPTGSYLGACKLLIRPRDSRFVCFPQNTLLGLCFRLDGKDGQPELLWQRTYSSAYWQGYGPLLVLADMDNDGKHDIVVAGKPGYAGVYDLDTGLLRFEAKYQVTDGPDIGRPYGFLTAEDLDADGYRDIVMASCQVEEYIGVVRNLGGKGLSHVWSQFIEKDYPEDHRELRPNVASVADIDGDGDKEIVVGLFNVSGDGKWHTVAFDSMKGYRSRLLDRPDRYFWGCYDLNGDGRAEVIVSNEAYRRTSEVTTLSAIDGQSGWQIGSVSAASVVTHDGPLALNTAFMAYRKTPVFIEGRGERRGLIVRRKGGKGPEELWSVSGGKDRFARLAIPAGARSVALSKPLPVFPVADAAFGATSALPGADAQNARIAEAGGMRELILEPSDGNTVGGQPNWQRPGKFLRSWSVPGSLPAVWLGPRGERVVCTIGPRKDEALFSRPDIRRAGTAWVRKASLPYPVYNQPFSKSGHTLLPFGDEEMRVFVGLQTGVHTLACGLYDQNGKPLWQNEKTGPYPRTAAAIRLGANDFELFVNDHYEKAIYTMQGSVRIGLPYGSRRGGTPVTTPYALPIVGPFGPQGETRIVLAPGLDAVQVLDTSGAVLASRSHGTYEFEYCGSAVGAIRRGQWDLGIVSQTGVFQCVAIENCQTRWSLDLGDKASFPIPVTAVDLDGDGRDNFLIGLPNGSLLALDERDGKGIVLWKLSLPAGVRECIAADLTGDGIAEVIAETTDGRVRVFADEKTYRALRPARRDGPPRTPARPQ